ncbi:flavin reductase family protein [Vitiosangium sp. GDMCC 1.1324]|uniref:flavin reductase family protein n=1 Tax=Vitiosangium sp. (strain GDMCC 1.1324) TaxID=2138576 RepID=UPI000D347FD5|nr:flavin reductase family protein [Vitiosangium sp. GDMCC 1.1324]PTL75786.1 flavin reductase [Vitiosangium sp. GDMCC 1.1324]
MRVPLELRRAYKLLNHGPTTLVTSAAHGRTNVMAAAWAMPLDFDPPKLAVVIAEGTFTRELVEASGEFTLCVPTRAQLEQVYAVGSVSGREEDKWALYGLRPSPASRVQAPLVEDCVGWLECRVLSEPDVQRRYDLFIAEVVAAWVEDSVWKDGGWDFSGGDSQRSVHHIAGGVFFTTGERVQAQKPTKK